MGRHNAQLAVGTRTKWLVEMSSRGGEVLSADACLHFLACIINAEV